MGIPTMFGSFASILRMPKQLPVPKQRQVPKRDFTSSLYATNRPKGICARTDLQFKRAAANDIDQLLTRSYQWMGLASRRALDTTDQKMQAIFNEQHRLLKQFSHAMQFEGIGKQGREAYFVHNACDEIFAVAWGRVRDAGNNCLPRLICANPLHLPDSVERINKITIEGADSFLARSLVDYASLRYSYLIFRASPLTQQGYFNLFQNPPLFKVDHGTPLFGLLLKERNFTMHGEAALRER